MSEKNVISWPVFNKQAIATLSAALVALGGLSACGKKEQKKELSSEITITAASTGNSSVYTMVAKGEDYTIQFISPRSREEATLDHLYYQINPKCVVTNGQRDIFRSLYTMSPAIRSLKIGETLSFLMSAQPDKTIDGRIRYSHDSKGEPKTYAVQKRPNCS